MLIEKKWSEMTAAERRQERFKWWLSPDGIRFSSPEAETHYKQRVQRFIDVYNVQEPDRVPVSLPVANMPAYLAGMDFHTVVYDYAKMDQAWRKFYGEFDMDVAASPGMALPGRVYDLLDYRLYRYPGHGLPFNATGIQFVEGEYMREDEYDALISNPSDFWMRIYMPRIFGAFEPWTMLSPFTAIIEMPTSYFMPYVRPEMRASAQVLIDVGKELSEWSKVVAGFRKWAQESGFPIGRSAFAKAPFDTLGDTLRGTRGIFMDMFRRPDKLLEAVEIVTDFTIKQTIAAANAAKALTVMFPLHKGSDGFMSQTQFEKFYWPSLRKVILALVDEGILPVLFAEGTYTSRLEIVNEFPKGAVSWLFDKTDMIKAKKILGNTCCISGNVPTALMIVGSPKDVKDYCRKLIEDCGKGGGYILAGGASIDHGNADNLRAMMEAAKEYGRYR